MPTVLPGSKVLVSGANGYIAMWVVKKLLEDGYSVRATVRKHEKGNYLKEYFNSYGDKLEIAIVEDITKEGAFDEAVKGVDAIEHMASPLTTETDDPDEYIKPAVQGTIGMLKSALSNGHSVKRVVFTSSCAAVISPSATSPRTYNESDWNEESVRTVEKEGRKAPRMEKYRASKTLAEKAGWDFMKLHKDELKWDFVALHPPLVLGPPIQELTTPESLNTSLKSFFDNVVVESPKPKETTLSGNAWIDVRDLAEAHVRAIHTEKAAGERIVICSGSYSWQDWINIANALNPQPYTIHPLPRGYPEDTNKIVHQTMYDNTKAKEILGMKFKGMEETARDTLANFNSRKW